MGQVKLLMLAACLAIAACGEKEKPEYDQYGYVTAKVHTRKACIDTIEYFVVRHTYGTMNISSPVIDPKTLKPARCLPYITESQK